MKTKNQYITFNGRNHSQVIDFIMPDLEKDAEYISETYDVIKELGIEVGDKMVYDHNGKLHGIRKDDREGFKELILKAVNGRKTN